MAIGLSGRRSGQFIHMTETLTIGDMAIPKEQIPAIAEQLRRHTAKTR